MAYYNDGKTFRNLPEQVDKNKTDIEEMQSTVEADEKNINDNMNKILAHDTRINALETTKLSASDSSIKLTRSNAEMGSVSIAKVGGNTLVNGNDIPLATINGESIMQNKDFTIDSNLSDLLWANLGIGRWANQTIVGIWGSGNFYDNLLSYYTNISRCFAYTRLTDTVNPVNIDFSNTVYNAECRATFYGVEYSKLTLNNATFFSPLYFFRNSQLSIINANNVYLKGQCYYTFSQMPNLTTIGEFDVSLVNNTIQMFHSLPKLKTIKCHHWKIGFNITTSTAFETEDLVEIISNLDPVSTTQTLTMGATNMAKLSNDDILIATGKGWQLA